MIPPHPLRQALLGNSGSGKTTLARERAAQYGVPVLDLDTVAFEPHRPGVRRPLENARADVRAFCAREGGWVVEGCYAELVETALEAGAELLFLDPGVERCLANCRARPWERHKYATAEEQDAGLAFLLTWVAEYYERDGGLSHAGHLALFEGYSGPKRCLGPRLT